MQFFIGLGLRDFAIYNCGNVYVHYIKLPASAFHFFAQKFINVSKKNINLVQHLLEFEMLYDKG